MAQFLTPLKAELLKETEGRSIWRLTDPLVYESDLVPFRISVPAGFQTDFASVPRIPLAYLLAGDTAHQAAVVHDWLYFSNGVSRKLADDIFYEAMTVTEIPWWRRYLMWLAVRLSGQSIWDSYRQRHPT